MPATEQGITSAKSNDRLLRIAQFLAYLAAWGIVLFLEIARVRELPEPLRNPSGWFQAFYRYLDGYFDL